MIDSIKPIEIPMPPPDTSSPDNMPIREKIRNRISEVGDDKTQIGIISDGLLAATYSISFLINAIASSSNLDEVKTKLSKDLIPLSSMIQDAITSGSFRLAYLAKEGRSVGAFNDLVTLSNKVADAITEFKPATETKAVSK